MKKILLILLFLTSTSAFAQQIPPISTDRPDQTESPDIVPSKYVQFETGFSYEELRFDIQFDEFLELPGVYKASISTFSTPDLLVRYGLRNNLELRLGTSFTSTTESIDPPIPSGEYSHSDFGPIMIGGKLKLGDEKELLPAASLLVEIEMPALTNKNSNSYFNPAIKLCFSNELNRVLDLSYNLGIQIDNEGSKAQTTGIYTVSLGLSLSNRVGMFTEIYGFIPFSGGDAYHYVDAGFTYLVNNNTQLDISGGYDLRDHLTDYFIAAGVSFRIPN